MRAMPVNLMLPVLLRVLASAAFIVAVIYAGIANRSVLIVPLLAFAAASIQWLVSVIAPSPITGLQQMVSPEAPPPNPAVKFGRGIGVALVLYLVLFCLSALIAALFQETEFARRLESADLWIAGIPALVAFAASVLSAKTGTSQVAGMMEDVQKAFADMQAQQAQQDMAADDDFIVEGEFTAANDEDTLKPGDKS